MPSKSGSWHNSAARRVQLAVKKSLRHLSSPPLPDFEENDAQVHNIDQALQSLYTESYFYYKQTQTTPSSYLPAADPDWILDGPDDWTDEVEQSEALLQEFYDSSNLDLLIETVLKQFSTHEHSGDEDHDGEEFGEFQSAMSSSACDSQEEKPNAGLDEGKEDCERISYDEGDEIACPGPNEWDPSNDGDSSNTVTSLVKDSFLDEEAELQQLTDLWINDRNDEIPTGRITPIPLQLGDPSTSYIHHSIAATSYQDIPMSLQMSSTDLATPEGRFIRRLQQENQSFTPITAADESLLDEGDLPGYYFTKPDFDDTVMLLQSLPWDSYESDFNAWEDCVLRKLSIYDGALRRVQTDLLHQVQSYESSSLAKANENIHEFQQNLQLAFLYWKRSKESLDLARGQEDDGLLGPGILLFLYQQREDLRKLSTVLEEMGKALDTEKHVIEQIERFDFRREDAIDQYRHVLATAHLLQVAVAKTSIARCGCIDELRNRMENAGILFRQRFLDLCKDFVLRCARGKGVKWIEYERLSYALMDLQHNLSFDGNALASDWVNSIVNSLCHEADRVLAVALLNPINCEPSKFSAELDQMALEVGLDWGDEAKLRTLTHNLITIRFTFESEKNYLPRVLRRLFVLLTDVLHTHFQIVQWHKKPFDDSCRDSSALHGAVRKEVEDTILSQILKNLEDCRNTLWDRCEAALTRCLCEHLNFAPRRVLFKKTDGIHDDSEWIKDLNDNHDILVMVERFLLLKSSFFEDTTIESGLAFKGNEEKSELFERLSDIFRRHLRSVHVEAMNTMGRCLANESWILTTFAIPRQKESTQETYSAALLLENAVLNACKFNLGNPKWRFCDEKNHSVNDFYRISEHGNPFACENELIVEIDKSMFDRLSDDEDKEYQKLRTGLHREMDSYLQNKDTQGRMAVESVAKELLGWFCRIFVTVERLPLLIEDASVVFANLCDLYLTTMLRLCCGNARYERILLGIDQPSGLAPANISRPNSPDLHGKQPGSPLFGSFRKERPKPTKARMQPTISVSLDAEIASPFLSELAETRGLQKFVVRAQDSLREIVNLERVETWITDPSIMEDPTEETCCLIAQVLEKREAAIWSCTTVAALVENVCKLIYDGSAMSWLKVGTRSLHPLRSYVCAIMEAVPALCSRSRRLVSVKAISGLRVVKEIIQVGQGWEECKLNEHPNDYIDRLIERVSLIWAFASMSAKLPAGLLYSMWEDLLSSVYLSLLEGFARVPFCSTEGRALMTLDLASFDAGVSPKSVEHRLEKKAVVALRPPSVNLKFGMRFVDTFIKVFYYPPEDALSWIKSNCDDYKLSHAISIINSVVGIPEQSPERKLEELIEDVSNWYKQKTLGVSIAPDSR